MTRVADTWRLATTFILFASRASFPSHGIVLPGQVSQRRAYSASFSETPLADLRAEDAFLRMTAAWCQPPNLGTCDPHCCACATSS